MENLEFYATKELSGIATPHIPTWVIYAMLALLVIAGILVKYCERCSKKS